jgi:IS4 transposase
MTSDGSMRLSTRRDTLRFGGAGGVMHQLVTDRCDLAPAEVVVLYRQRWPIEVCFRWL